MKSQLQRKKEREQFQLESFIKVMNLPWTVVRPGDDQDEPDYFVQTEEGLTGVEITQLFVDRKAGMASSPRRETEMRRNGKLRRLADEYYQRSDIPVHAQFLGFNEDAIPQTAAMMAEVAGDLIPMEGRRFELGDDVVVHLLRLPLEMRGYRRWEVVSDRVGWVTPVEAAALHAVVTPKRERLAAYRRSAARVVLLVVVDGTWPSGMIKNAGQLAVQEEGFDAVYLHVFPDVARRLDSGSRASAPK